MMSQLLYFLLGKVTIADGCAQAQFAQGAVFRMHDCRAGRPSGNNRNSSINPVHLFITLY